MAWHAKATGAYSPSSSEGLDNVKEITYVLRANGWKDKSIAAFLGNGAGESGLNPWRWESDYVPTYAEFESWDYTASLSHGYGLVGFTPANTYINTANSTLSGYAPNFSDRPGAPSDGAAQMKYLSGSIEANWAHNLFLYYNDDFNNIGVDISTFYYTTYYEFIRDMDGDGNSMPLDYLVGAFELCYEKPADWAAASSYAYRCQQAAYWLPIIEAIPPSPIYSTHKMPIWFYLKPHWKTKRR